MIDLLVDYALYNFCNFCNLCNFKTQLALHTRIILWISSNFSRFEMLFKGLLGS